MNFNRRKLLIGIGGAIVGLPYLEGLVRKGALDHGPATFALFYRRANGVQQDIGGRAGFERAVRIMSMRARNVAGTWRCPG